MKRRRIIIRVVVFLLLGAIVNVAVAWACVLSLPPQHDHHSFTPNERKMTGAESFGFLQPVFNDIQIVPTEVHGTTQHRFGWRQADAGSFYDYARDPRLEIWASYTRAGWPLHSVAGGIEWDGRVGEATGDLDSAGQYVGAIKVPEWARPRGPGNRNLIDFIPYWPLWPGFYANTIFFAVILWLLWTTPFAVRKWRRIKRGRCAKCGYDLRGTPPDHAVCPECGEGVPERIRPKGDCII
jgi:hypothetical protein